MFSLLICDHGSLINVYANGFPLGVIMQGEFTPDPLAVERNPFETEQALNLYLIQIAEAVHYGMAEAETINQRKEALPA